MTEEDYGTICQGTTIRNPQTNSILKEFIKLLELFLELLNSMSLTYQLKAPGMEFSVQ